MSETIMEVLTKDGLSHVVGNVKTLVKSSIQTIDWDSITNKPFGIENFSNTVTWDGDITDATQHGYFYQISDVIPTYDDFLNGYTIVVAYNDTETVVTVSAANASNNISVSPDGTYFICGGGGMTDLCVIALKTNNSIQKTGIYFYYANNSGNILYTKSLTINDYQGFPGAIKKIDKMYLPDILTEADVQTIVNNTFSNAEEAEF